MTAPPRDPPAQPGQAQATQTKHNRQVIAALVAVLVAGATLAPYPLLVSEVAVLLLGLRPAPAREDVDWLLAFGLSDVIPTGIPYDVGPVQKLEQRQAPAWRALYLVVACQRLALARAAGPAELEVARLRESGYFEAHLRAEERRMRSAALVDATARLLEDRLDEPLLGWRAVLDSRTTRECRWAHGRNFRADQMPVIGCPGAVHVRCRCSAGPPIPGAPLIPSA